MKTIIATFKYIALVLVCASLCTGCQSTRTGTDFNSANVSKLKVGETTEQEVIQLIGQPSNRTQNSDGTASLSYMYDPGKTFNVFSGFNPHAAENLNAGMKTLEVILDANGKIKSFTQTGPQQ